MQEEEFYEKLGKLLDEKLGYWLDKIDRIDDYIQTTKLINKSNLADFSKTEPKAKLPSDKYMVEYNGQTYTYKKDAKCKYCHEHYVSWDHWSKGLKPLAISEDGEALGFGCPSYIK